MWLCVVAAKSVQINYHVTFYWFYCSCNFPVRQTRIKTKTPRFALNLRQNRDFRRLSDKHRLDDPAVWSTLQKRFVLNIADLQDVLVDAKSMMAAKDSRSSLNNEVVSAENIRAKGRQLRAETLYKMEDMRHMLRLIDEFQAAFEKAAADQAITGEISIENTAGQSFVGQVLFIDGKDLIVKRGEAAYFRVPAKLLSDETKLEILNEMTANWQALPEMSQEAEIEDKNAGELIAYSESHLYIDDRFEGLVGERRAKSEFTFVPYQEQMKQIREAATDNRDERALLEEQAAKLKEGHLLNQSRIETIQWLESRLGLSFPESEREEAKAYREEKYGEPDAEETSGEELENSELSADVKQTADAAEPVEEAEAPATDALPVKVE